MKRLRSWDEPAIGTGAPPLPHTPSLRARTASAVTPSFRTPSIRVGSSAKPPPMPSLFSTPAARAPPAPAPSSNRRLADLSVDLESDKIFSGNEVLLAVEREANALSDHQEQLLLEKIKQQQDMINNLQNKLDDATATPAAVIEESSKLRKRLLDTEQLLAKTKSKAEEAAIQLEGEKQSHLASKKHLEAKVAELQRHRKHLLDGEEQLKLKQAASEEEHLRKVQAQEARIRTLEKEREDAVFTRHSSSSQTRLERELQAAKAQTQLLATEKESLEEQVKLQKQQLDTLAEEAKEVATLREQFAQAERRIRELAARPEEEAENAKLAKAMKSDFENYVQLEANYKAVVRERNQLKTNARNAELLKIELEGMREKAEKARELQTTLSRALVEKETLENETKQWYPMLASLNVKSPHQLISMLSDLRRENEILVEKNGSLNAELRALQSSSGSFDETVTELTEKLANAHKQQTHLQETSRKQERLLKLAQNEVQSLRSLVDSYYEEETVHGSGDQLKLQRIRDLEAAVAERNALLEELKKNGSASANTAELQSERDALAKENEQLATRIALMETRLGRGEFDSSTTKAQLKIENASLLSKIKQMEEFGGGAEALRAKELYRTKVAQLKDNFKKQIRDVREISCQMLGYRLDKDREEHNCTIYRIQSVFAEPDDFFLFASTKNGIEMLETSFSQQCAPQIEEYVTRRHCVPAFLANITLELVDKKTF